MLRTPQVILVPLFGITLLLGCTSTDPCDTGSTGGGGEGGGGAAASLGPINYEDCPKGIMKVSGQLNTFPFEGSYATTLVQVNQADPETGLDVELAEGGGLHVTWRKSESTWPGPTHIGGSFRLPDSGDIPQYLPVRRDLSGLVTKDLDNAKFHLVGYLVDLTGCTNGPAK